MYINILFIIILLVVVIMIARQKELSGALKGFVITMLMLTIALAILYEYSHVQSNEKARPTLKAFKLGQQLTCDDHDINTTIYTYEPGTASFQPKLGVVGEVYGVEECSPTK